MSMENMIVNSTILQPLLNNGFLYTDYLILSTFTTFRDKPLKLQSTHTPLTLP